jgi:hypothetical protein
MKRLNPDTGEPFKYGAIREDGRIFTSYSNRINKNGYFVEQWLSLDSFNKHKSIKIKNYQDSKETILQKNKEYYLINKETIAKQKSEYKKQNRGRYNALSRIREEAKSHRTPSWLNSNQKREIIDLYEQAKKLKDATGNSYHVDHIIPLCGKTVSGLHVPWNLQVIPAQENLKKYNKFVLENHV